jgi:uncharacterized protein
MEPRRFRGLPTARIGGAEVPVAEGTVARLLGLALLSREEAGPGLLIPRCHAIHSFGMRFELSVLFLDRDGEIVRETRLRRGRFVACRSAESVLELAV